MDIWEKMYLKAKTEYHPEEVSPFIDAHHVVCAIEAENGEIYTGFCIEGASGVINLCAERVAGLNMYIQSGQTVVKNLLLLGTIHQVETEECHVAHAENFLCNFPPKIKIWKY